VTENCGMGNFFGRWVWWECWHDPHLLYTLSSVQILALLDRIDVLDDEKVADCIIFIDDICKVCDVYFFVFDIFV